MTIKVINYSAITLLLTCSLAGCATYEPLPSSLLAEAESELKLADSVGASQGSPLAFRSASENLASAKKAIEDEEYADARLLLEKALADAQFAAAKTQAQKAQSTSNQVDENLKALKKAL